MLIHIWVMRLPKYDHLVNEMRKKDRSKAFTRLQKIAPLINL